MAFEECFEFLWVGFTTWLVGDGDGLLSFGEVYDDDVEVGCR